MSYSLYITRNTFVDNDKLSVEGITDFNKSSSFIVSQTFLDLSGWKFGEEMSGWFELDKGEIDQEDVIDLYTRYCRITEQEVQQSVIDFVENSEWGLEHGKHFFTYIQSY
jgi:hypothetical protein